MPSCTMPTKLSPEEAVKALHDASETIKSRVELCKQFPDIGETFIASNSRTYDVSNESAVQPFVSKCILTMPPTALEQMRQWRPTQPAGLLLPIYRAYFVIGNRLHLWNYLDGQTINTYEDSSDIVCVGIAPPKRSIFSDEVTHVLVVATVHEINLIAISYKSGLGNTDELTFFRTGIMTPSSGVNMKSIMSTSSGRIFMLGEDGNVWELEYKREEGWFTSRCYKKLYPTTSSFSFLFKSMQDPCVSIALSDDGTCLYELFESSSIQVVYLGADGQSFTDVFKNTKICDEAMLVCADSSLVNRNTFKIISVHPTSATESKKYHLVAVTTSGCRLYFSHYKRGRPAATGEPPNALELIHIRLPPPSQNVQRESLPWQPGMMRPSQPLAPVANTGFGCAQKIQSCLYRHSVLLVAHDDNSDGLIATASPDVGRVVSQRTNPNLYELTNILKMQGKVITMAEIPIVDINLDELAGQPSSPTRHFLALTTSGLIVIMKQRPVDMLNNLLSFEDTTSGAADFQDFFAYFGAVQASALCFSIVSGVGDPSENSSKMFGNKPVSDPVAHRAAELLETLGQELSALNKIAGPQFTSRHDGLALYISRVIDPIWSKKLIIEERSRLSQTQYISAVKRSALTSIQATLRQLQTYIASNNDMYPITEPRTPEDFSLRQLYDMVVLLVEAISFILYLIENGISKIMQSLSKESQAAIKNSTFESMLSTPSGRKLMSDLAAALIEDHVGKYSNIDLVVEILERHCGAFCSSTDVILYKAVQQMRTARSAPNTNQSRILQSEALHLLKRIAGHIPCEKVNEIAREYVTQGCYLFAVDLALTCATARDPNMTTSAYVQEGCPPNDPRSKVFLAKKPFYDCVFGVLKELITTAAPPTHQHYASEKAANMEQVFQSVFHHKDLAFQYYIYEKFVEHKLSYELIKANPPHLESFLKREPFSYERYELLADYYRQHDRFDEAALCYEMLANQERNADKRMELLRLASVCAKSVAAPNKQFEMHNLIDRLDNEMQKCRR